MPITTTIDLSQVNRVFNAGDWDRDGYGDIITRNRANGALYLRTGNGNRTFDRVRRIGRGFGRIGLLAAVGDVTGDGYPDLMGQPPNGAMRIYPGRGLRGFRQSFVAYSRITADRQIPIGRWTGDGAPDALYRQGSSLVARTGNGPGGLTGSARTVGLDLRPYDWVVGISDVGLTGHPDLVVRTRRHRRGLAAARDGAPGRRPAVPGHGRRLRHGRLSRRRGRGRGDVMGRSGREAGGGTLGGVGRLEKLPSGPSHQHEGAAA